MRKFDSTRDRFPRIFGFTNSNTDQLGAFKTFSEFVVHDEHS